VRHGLCGALDISIKVAILRFFSGQVEIFSGEKNWIDLPK
jgi:hypothetical protein